MAIENRLTAFFASRPPARPALSIFALAGYPFPGATLETLESLEAAGADIVELSFPFSDPIADGPTIQAANARALAGGMNLEKLFEEIRPLRSRIRLPIVLMGYYNPILQYGVERFIEDAAACGIDGFIVPDLPLAEYRRDFETSMKARNLSMIFLVTSRTPEKRVRELDAASSGFLYVVSSDATTGGSVTSEGARDDRFEFVRRLRAMKLANPLVVGFGVKTRTDFEAVTEHAAGAIIGSQFLREIENADTATLAPRIKSYLTSIRSPL